MKLLIVDWEDAGVLETLDVEQESEIDQENLDACDDRAIDILRFHENKFQKLVTEQVTDEEENVTHLTRWKDCK